MSDTILYGVISLNLLVLSLLVVSVWLSSDKIHIQIADLQRDMLSQFPKKSQETFILPVSEQYSMNIVPIYTERCQVRVTLLPGKQKVYFSGTASQVAKQVYLSLMTGQEKNGNPSPLKSFVWLVKKESSLYSSDQSPGVSESTSPELTTEHLWYHIPRR